MTLDAAEAWVRKPSDENRRLAKARADAIIDTQAPAAWAATAAGWSSGSIGPKDVPDIPPEPFMTGVATFTAVLLAAGVDPENAEARFTGYLERGIDIAKGGTGRPTNGGA